MIISDNIDFESVDLTETIESNLTYLKGMSKHVNSYLVDMEDQADKVIKSYKVVGTEEKISSIEEDIENLAIENINLNIENLKLKVIASGSIIGSGEAINRYYSNELSKLKNIDQSPEKINIADLLNLDNTTQTESSKMSILMYTYEEEIIEGLSIEAAFKETEQLIASQINLSSSSISPTLFENIDLWNEDLEYYRDLFLLDDKGNFDYKYALDKIFEKKQEEYSDGSLLTETLPSNYSSEMSVILEDIEYNSSTDPELLDIVSQLPPGYSSMNPMALTSQFPDVMSQLTSKLSELQNIGNLSNKITGALNNLPTNMNDVMGIINGNMSGDIQGKLYSVVSSLNNLTDTDLSKLYNVADIAGTLKQLPDLNSLMSSVQSGNLAMLGNYSSQLSSLTNQLQNVSNLSLPGNLNSVINSLPTNFSSIMSGVGGIPSISNISNITSSLTGNISNITSSVTGMVNNVSNLAGSALSSLGNLASLGSFGKSMFGGGTGSPGPVVPPELY